MASGPGGLHTDVIHRPRTEPGTVFRTSPGHLRFPVSLDGLERCSNPRRDCQKTFGFRLWGGQCPLPQGWQMGCVHLPKPGNQPVTRRVRLAGCRWGTGNQPFFPVENRRRSRRKQRRNPEFGQQGVPVILSQSLPEWGFPAPRGILAAVLPQAHTVDTGEHIFL